MHGARWEILTPRETLKGNLLGESGAAMRSRTSNLLIRSQMLYPIELWLQGKQGGE